MDYPSTDKFREELLEWYAENGRKFYWRDKELSAFQILLLELFLKRTRAEIVDKYAEEVVSQLSDPYKIDSMEYSEIVDLIEPMGLYNRRSETLQKISSDLINRFEGEVPSTREDLLSIYGIGDYIANAVRCYAYGVPVVVVDINVARVAEHYFGMDIPSDLRQGDEIQSVFDSMIPETNPTSFNNALLDLGAELNTKQDCPDCPLNLPCIGTQ